MRRERLGPGPNKDRLRTAMGTLFLAKTPGESNPDASLLIMTHSGLSVRTARSAAS